LGNNAANVRIPIDQGIVISKVTGTNLVYQLVGAVKLGPTLIPIGGTNNFVGNVYATSATTLTNSLLFTGNAATGLVGGGTAAAADNVLIHNDTTGAFAKYFWFNGKGTAGWRDTLGADASNVQIPIGADVVIALQPGHNGFNYTGPTPY
jgi:hypothetical protein